MTDPLPDEPGERYLDGELIEDLEPGEDVDEFADELTAPPEIADEPAAAEDVEPAPAIGFFDAGPDARALDDLTLAGRPGVLERLGPAHFRSKGFSFMGFLQTVYDHVSTEIGGQKPPRGIRHMTKIRNKAFASILCSIGVVHAGAAESQAVDFPTFGIQMTPPPGCKNVQPAAPGRIVTYAMPGGSNLLVEIKTAGGMTAVAVAEKLAGKDGPKVTPSDTPVGGEPAAVVEMALVNSVPFTRRQLYVVVHNDFAYLFSAVRTEKDDPAQAFSALLKSVRFTPPKPPVGELVAMSEDAWAVFEKFTIAFPVIVRPVTSNNTNVHFGVYDYTRPGKLGNPWNLDIERLTLPNPKPFVEVRDSYSSIMREQLKMEKPFVWTTDPRVPGLYLSQPQLTTVKGRNGTTVKVTQRFCVLELATGDLVQIAFAVSDIPAADVAKYNEMADRVLKTIKLLPAAK